MVKYTEYTDDDMMRYTYEVIDLICNDQYHTARMDTIRLDCVQKFEDKWIALIRSVLELSKNSSENMDCIETEIVNINSDECDNDDDFQDDNLTSESGQCKQVRAY